MDHIKGQYDIVRDNIMKSFEQFDAGADDMLIKGIMESSLSGNQYYDINKAFFDNLMEQESEDIGKAISDAYSDVGIVKAEADKDKKSYEKKVRALMKKWGIDSISELSEKEKRKFFGKLDQMHISDKEEDYVDKATEDELKKGKKASPGEIREWGGKKYQKQSSGRWKPYSEGGSDKKEKESNVNYKDGEVEVKTKGGDKVSIKSGDVYKNPSNGNKIEVVGVDKDPKSKKGDVDIKFYAEEAGKKTGPHTRDAEQFVKTTKNKGFTEKDGDKGEEGGNNKDSDVDRYVEKFKDKMSGTVPSEAAHWVDGIGTLSTKQKKKVWNKIQDSLGKKDRDRGAEHGVFPKWVNKGDNTEKLNDVNKSEIDVRKKEALETLGIKNE